MFSMATMELSTSMPMPRLRPPSDITFSVMPVKYMHTNAITTLMGIENAMVIVGRRSIRNSSRISIARPPPDSRLFSTESTMILMYSPWFIRSTMCRFGSAAISSSARVRTVLATSAVE